MWVGSNLCLLIAGLLCLGAEKRILWPVGPETELQIEAAGFAAG